MTWEYLYCEVGVVKLDLYVIVQDEVKMINIESNCI